MQIITGEISTYIIHTYCVDGHHTSITINSTEETAFNMAREDFTRKDIYKVKVWKGNVGRRNDPNDPNLALHLV